MKKAICCLLCLLMMLPWLLSASGDTALSVSYVMPDGRSESVLSDANVMTRITIKRGTDLTLKLSDAGVGRTAYLEWYTLPEDAQLVQYDAQNKQVAAISFSAADGYRAAVPLEENCTKATLSAGKSACTVSTLFVTEGEPDASYHWMQPVTSCDMLFIAPTPADAMESFGPLLAKYGAAHGVSVGVAVMTVDHRYCSEELEIALLQMGIRNAPIYLGCDDLNYLEANEIHKRWEENEPADKLAALVGTLQPKVVVSVGGEKENDLRGAETVQIVKQAMQQTEVQKFYVASAAGTTVIDCSESVPSLANRSACNYATEAYYLMKSRGVYRFKLPEKPAFRLESQTVGPDLEANDLLENIDKSALSNYTEIEKPTPEPTEAPTQAPTPEPVAAAEQPTAAIVYGITDEEPEEELPTPAPMATEEPRRFGLFSCGGVAETPAPTEAPQVTAVPTAEPTPEPTAEPTEEPTPEPTEAPTPEPTPEPTPTPVPYQTFAPTNFDEHFINDGGPEFVSFDNENGEWIYRSDILAVEINRVSTTYQNGKKPVVYFVAHIFERGYDSFRPTFGSWKHNGMDLKDAKDMAKEIKAVLWITGDNLINSDAEKKGTLIRDGYLFQKSTRIDSFRLDPETREMKIVRKNEMSAEELWESGVENCFSFGPVTIENGKITKEAASTRRTDNPRTLFGMVEPGHFIAVVADGRQPGYSLGLNGEECAKLMLELGCQTAYNLDGGISATMIFMGNKINRHGTARYNGLASGKRTMPDGLTWGYSELCGTFEALQEDNG